MIKKYALILGSIAFIANCLVVFNIYSPDNRWLNSIVRIFFVPTFFVDISLCGFFDPGILPEAVCHDYRYVIDFISVIIAAICYAGVGAVVGLVLQRCSSNIRQALAIIFISLALYVGCIAIVITVANTLFSRLLFIQAQAVAQGRPYTICNYKHTSVSNFNRINLLDVLWNTQVKNHPFDVWIDGYDYYHNMHVGISLTGSCVSTDVRYDTRYIWSFKKLRFVDAPQYYFSSWQYRPDPKIFK